MDNTIEVSRLVKTFGRTSALDGLDLTVHTGEVHGFVGPNGSGKTTTIRILLGVLRADAGQVTVLGGDPWDDAVALHRRLAYVPGEVNLWPKLTGGEVIDLLARLRGDLDPRRRDELLERFELDPTKKARSYSKGNRQKVALVAALASSAELLILDEPTSGLDPAHGVGVPGLRAGGQGPGPHRAAVEPHPGRGRGAVRPGQHHPLRAARSRAEPWASSAAARRPRWWPRPTDHRAGSTLLAGVTDLELDDHRVRFSVETDHLEAAVRLLVDHGLRA